MTIFKFLFAQHCIYFKKPMSPVALATCYVLFLMATVFSTIQSNQVVVSVKNNRAFATGAIILGQLTSMIGSAVVTVALAS